MSGARIIYIPDKNKNRPRIHDEFFANGSENPRGISEKQFSSTVAAFRSGWKFRYIGRKWKLKKKILLVKPRPSWDFLLGDIGYN